MHSHPNFLHRRVPHSENNLCCHFPSSYSLNTLPVYKRLHLGSTVMVTRLHGDFGAARPAHFTCSRKKVEMASGDKLLHHAGNKICQRLK